MNMEHAEAWNEALRENMSPNERLVQVHERLTQIRESLGLPEPDEDIYHPDYNLPEPDEDIYHPDYNPVTPVLDKQGRLLGLAAYEEMLFAPADWQKQEAQS